MIYDRMANAVRQAGNNIFTNTAVYGVVNDKERVTGILLEDGSYKEYDHVVSTMPYTAMVKRLTEVPPQIVELAGKLKFRNTIIVYLLINSTDLFPDNWIYIHSPELQMGRVTNFRNWVPHLYQNEQKTILAIEYWSDEDAALWNTADQDLINLASAEIAKTNLVDPNLIEDGFVYRIAKSYPVYTRGYKEIVDPINAYLASLKNLSVIGRYGSFKYNNQDHSIIMGLKAAENIIDNAGHDLFGINADYEVYQESYIVKDTGLQKH
jgi:protoporphyrinogen oxidase